MTRELTTTVGRQNISLRDAAAALFRRKWMVLVIFLTVLLATLAFTLVLPDRYESHMKILVKNSVSMLRLRPATSRRRVRLATAKFLRTKSILKSNCSRAKTC